MRTTAPHITKEEFAAQFAYCEAVRPLLLARAQGQPTACVMTFGCQQNEADSELIRGMLLDMGCRFTDEPMQADLALLNTCAVREHAEDRVFGHIGALSHLKKARPNAVVALCGCMAQQEHVAQKVRQSYPHVDLVFGTHALARFPELLYERLSGSKRVFDLGGDERGVILEGVTPHRLPGPRAWVSIMYGCDNFCSYCVVPYVRGRERSREPDAIVREVQALVAEGRKEITLLGQNVNSYGQKGGTCDFSDLLRRINDIEGDFCIRFTTSHPKDAGRKLFDTMAACDKVCRHLHLPVQSGSDRVLRAMNRGYTSGQYVGLIDYARSVMPEITFTSDIIVGFPGETGEEFAQTLELVGRVGFESLYTFLYSRREGTAAAALADDTPRAVKQERFDRLVAMQNAATRRGNEQCVGRTLRVLVDGRAPDGSGRLSGRTQSNRIVHLDGPEALIGGFAQVVITGCTNWTLRAQAQE